MSEEKNPKPLIQQIKELQEEVSSGKKGKKKKINLRRAKVKRVRLKKGSIGVVTIQENGSSSQEKQKVEDFTFKTKDGGYHATDGRETIMWDGKYPVIFQPTWKLNPLNLRLREGEVNETYGQKYVMARMLKDSIKEKGKGAGKIIVWVIVIAIIIGVTKLLKLW